MQDQSSLQSNRGRRTIRFRVAAVLLAILPFLLLEGSLRLLAPDAVLSAIANDPIVQLEHSRPLFELQNSPQDDQGQLESTDPTPSNSEKRWVIPESRRQFFERDSFSSIKHPGTRRIFVLGGSTTQGRPYSIETSFSAWLKLHLEAAAPDVSMESEVSINSNAQPKTTFEVVNCGGVSYASYRVAKIVDEVLEHQPDGIVIYTGHNEFLEDRQYAQVRELGPWRRRVSQVATSLHTVNWLRHQFASDEQRSTQSLSFQGLPREVDTRLDHPGGLEKYVRDSFWKSSVEQQFVATFSKMVHSIKQAGVPLVVCVPRSDLVNTPPFKIAMKESLDPTQQQSFESAWAIVQNQQADFNSRLDACRDCLRIDPHHAGAHYVLGRLHYDHGNANLAREHLVAALDHDVCPLRATSPIVQAVIRESSRNQIDVIDPLLFFDRSNRTGMAIPDGIADPTFFVDHVHPSISGHQRIAAAIAEQLLSLEWFEPVSDRESRFAELADRHLASLGPEYYARGQQRLKGLRQWASGRTAVPLLPTKEQKNH